VPEASVTVKIPVIGVEEHQFTVMLQLAPGASRLQSLVWVNGAVILTDLTDVLVLSGFVTVAVPDAQANMTSKEGEMVTRAPLPLKGTDLLAAPFKANCTDPLRSPPVVGWKVTVARQLSPAISVDGQLFVVGKSANDEITEVTANGARPMLLSCVVSGGLATPSS